MISLFATLSHSLSLSLSPPPSLSLSQSRSFSLSRSLTLPLSRSLLFFPSLSIFLFSLSIYIDNHIKIFFILFLPLTNIYSYIESSLQSDHRRMFFKEHSSQTILSIHFFIFIYIYIYNWFLLTICSTHVTESCWLSIWFFRFQSFRQWLAHKRKFLHQYYFEK